jgi:hypothetical protein
MITSSIEIPHADLRFVVQALCTLPEPLRPTHHRFGEDEDGKPIKELEKFLDLQTNAGLGPFLTSDAATYDVGFFDGLVGDERVKSKTITCRITFKCDADLISIFFNHISVVRPIFGFACDESEYQYRNRVIAKRGMNTVESWVGRDLEKYVPGLYWFTLLSDSLLERHNVSISSIKALALHHSQPSDGLHLFNFYERPSDWKNNSVIEEACSSLNGFFNIKKAKDEIESAQNFLDLQDVLRSWK